MKGHCDGGHATESASLLAALRSDRPTRRSHTRCFGLVGPKGVGQRKYWGRDRHGPFVGGVRGGEVRLSACGFSAFRSTKVSVCGVEAVASSFWKDLRGHFEKQIAGGPLVAARALHHENGHHSRLGVDG